ncbi:MAG: SlyX family protein [Archangium sp.]|nr:SlyX family protein [Archangium sp.]MDP3155501.1 SlyX family protein [Archangium sp.]MDP3573833.1 SlyX family protein [Archangium sp.]
MSETRLADLEVKCAHLEKMLADLSEVMWRQQQELDALKDGYRQVRERLKGDPGLVDASVTERPPHY